MELYLVRHGETAANVAGVYYGATDVALTDNGIAQAQAVAKQLHQIKFDQVICSGLQRARHTAEVVLGNQSTPLTSWNEFNEIHFGEWEMQHYTQLQQQDAERYQQWCDDWLTFCFPGGESFLQFSQRITQAVSRLKTQCAQQRVLLVAHQGVFSAMMTQLLKMPPDAMWHFNFQQGTHSHLILNNDIVRICALNNGAQALSSRPAVATAM